MMHRASAGEPLLPPGPFDATDMPTVMARLADDLLTANYGLAFEKCAPIVEEGITTNFATSSTPDGTPWPPRKDPKPKHPLLILSGKMLGAAGVGAGHVLTIDEQSLAWGIDLNVVKYARAQDRGNPKRNLPARHFMGISEQFKDRCEATFGSATFDLIYG